MIEDRDMKSHRLPSLACVLLLGFVAGLLGASQLQGGSAIWKAAPFNNEWTTAKNWTPRTVPNGPLDTATFDESSITNISISSPIEVDEIVFDAAATQFIISTMPDAPLTISGTGISNRSGNVQEFVITGGGYSGIATTFHNSATAGTSTVFTIGSSPDSDFGRVDFYDSSTAGTSIFELKGDQCDSCGPGGRALFFGAATAGESLFILDSGAVPYVDGAFLSFSGTSTAGSSTLIANGATNGGLGARILFFQYSTGSAVRVQAFGNGSLDVSGHVAPGVSIGSIEGDGLLLLGAMNLTVGSTNLSSVFSGIVADGGFAGGTGGSLTKVGTGTLTLGGTSIYTGGTIVEDGTLSLMTKGGSATGSGLVQVNAGTLAGTGKVSGAITLGTGSGAGAIISPGGDGIGALTTKRKLRFNSDGTYSCQLSTRKSRSDQVSARGVVINSGAAFSFTALDNVALESGTVFIVIQNTSSESISGAFGNLPDGSTLTAGPNTFVVSYSGGTGNDLTLTVL